MSHYSSDRQVTFEAGRPKMTATFEAATAEVPEEERSRDDAFAALVARLSQQSVTKHFDAYADVPWDDEAYRIDPEDPRWELPADDPLGATEWYQRLDQPTRARLGLDTVASKMKIGLEFESVLKRGLLEFASTLPNGSPEFRYTYHEVIEEAQHSLMFQEFVNRGGFGGGGPRPLDRAASRWIVVLGRLFPELFFIFVLGGEDPIDHVQRRELRSNRTMPPLLERNIRIPVTEEAPHLRPKLSAPQRPPAEHGAAEPAGRVRPAGPSGNVHDDAQALIAVGGPI